MKVIRLYEHARARVEGAPGESVDAWGWDYTAGDVVSIDGERHALIVVRNDVLTGDYRGNYVTAEAEVIS